MTYPDVYQRFLNAVDVLNFDLGWVLSAGCVVNIDFHGRMLVGTLGPMAVIGLLGITYAVAVCRNRRSEAALRTVRHKHASMVLLVTFLVYSSASSMVFKMFDCDSLDDGIRYLRADYSIDCDSERHQNLQIYAALMIVLYPVGIPASYTVLLYRNRHILQLKYRREDDVRVRSTSPLWEAYKPSRFYYEVIECCRRISLAGIVLIIDDDTGAQIAVTLIVAMFFVFVSEGLAPYESRLDAWVSRTGHAVVAASIYLALLLEVDVSEREDGSQRAFEMVLVVTHVCMMIAVVGESVATFFSLRVQERPNPRTFRRGREWFLPRREVVAT